MRTSPAVCLDPSAQASWPSKLDPVACSPPPSLMCHPPLIRSLQSLLSCLALVALFILFSHLVDGCPPRFTSSVAALLVHIERAHASVVPFVCHVLFLVAAARSDGEVSAYRLCLSSASSLRYHLSRWFSSHRESCSSSPCGRAVVSQKEIELVRSLPSVS